MSNIFKATRYQLSTFKLTSIICLAAIIFNIMISVIITYLFKDSNLYAGISDMIAYITMFNLGIVFFKPSFKFLLANGISRKSLLKANILSITILSVVWGIIVALILWLIKILDIKIIMMYPLFYTKGNLFGDFVWLTSAFFLLITLGWFINMLYYRSSKPMRLAISFTPFILLSALSFVNKLINGQLFSSIGTFFSKAMGFTGNGYPNPYFASLNMLLFAVMLGGFNYLLIRRAEIRE